MKRLFRKASCLHKQAGFSIVEILVFVSIISFLFITLTATVTASLRRMSTAERRVYATHYAEELQEWLRAEKEVDWDAFVNRDISGSGTVYCFNGELNFEAPEETWSLFDSESETFVYTPGENCPDVETTDGDSEGYDGIWERTISGEPPDQTITYQSGDISIPRVYKRYAILTRANLPTTQMNIQIVVEWKDGNQYYSVPLNIIFAQFSDN